MEKYFTRIEIVIIIDHLVGGPKFKNIFETFEACSTSSRNFLQKTALCPYKTHRERSQI